MFVNEINGLLLLLHPHLEILINFHETANIAFEYPMKSNYLCKY